MRGFRKGLKKCWTSAAQHAAEVHRRHELGLPECKFEFASKVLANVEEPKDTLDAHMGSIMFFAKHNEYSSIH